MSNAKNIERNRLDYLLTDTMPVELTELFSYSQFYDFLFSRQKEVDRLVRDMKLQKNRNKEIPFIKGDNWGNWATIPLKYGIMKGINGTRMLNLVQPMAALHMYFFVSCYQKEILDQLKQNACFSLRYHSQNNNLCYRSKKKKVSSYFWKTSKKIDRAVLQQTGMFFKIRNYYSIVDFTGSHQWRTCNFRYRYFAKADYKSCFDSIYTHAFKWCINKDTVDSKNASNSNLNIAIDRILQNINGHSSNGVIIGPEFSRMIAEVLLGHIDKEVKYELERIGLRSGRDYRIFRFVDDLFIFSNNPEDQDKILDTMGRVSQKYLLQLNESKCVKTTTPVVLSTWIGECRELAAQISELFFRKSEVAENKGPLVKNRNVQITRMMEDFVDLIKAHPREEHHIVSFILSTLLNNISSKKDGYTLFDKNTIKTKPYMLLELAMYFYSFCPNFESTRKILSMLVYMNDELHFKANKNKKVDAEEYHHKKLVALIRRYAFIFEKANLNDLVNWFVFFYEYQISLKSGTERLLEEKLEREDNPLLWANYLIYSRYYDGYHKQIVERINDLLANKLDELRSNEITMQQEFWYVLVFGNCPYISVELRSEMSSIIKRLYSEDPWEQTKREILPAVDLALQENISDDVKIELVKYKTLLHKPTFSEQLMDMKKSIVVKMNKARTDKFLAKCPASLEKLVIRFTGLEQMNLQRLTGLKNLMLEHNPTLQQLKGLGQMKELKKLHLTHTAIQSLELPEPMTELNVLYADRTALEEAEFLQMLPGLRVLNLGKTPLTRLPSLEQLSMLKVLTLNNTLLPHLEGVSIPASLSSLDLSGTNIQRLPETIRGLKKLRSLNLSHMKLEELPKWLPELELAFSLESRGSGIRLYGTQVQGVNMSIFEQPREMVVQWFRGLEENDYVFNTVKVALVGNKRVGKTALLHRLVNDGSDILAVEKGIANKVFSVNGQSRRVQFWDIGEPEMQFLLHNKFLGDRALYMVVLDAQDTNIIAVAEYWLREIGNYAPNVPVMLVVNKLDQAQDVDLDGLEDLRSSYENIRLVLTVSSVFDSADQFQRSAKQPLLEQILRFPELVMNVPQSW